MAHISRRKSPSVDIYVRLQKRILAGRFSAWTYLATATPLAAAGSAEVPARLASIHTPSCPAAAADKEITLTVTGVVIKRVAGGTRARRRLGRAPIGLLSATLGLAFTSSVSRCVERSLAVCAGYRVSGFSDTGLLEQAHPFSQQAVKAESHGDSRRDAFIRLPYQLTPGSAVLVRAGYV